MTFLQLIANLEPDGTFSNGKVADPLGAYMSTLLLNRALAERIGRQAQARQALLARGLGPGASSAALSNAALSNAGSLLTTRRGERRKPLTILGWSQLVDGAGQSLPNAANDNGSADRDEALAR